MVSLLYTITLEQLILRNVSIDYVCRVMLDTIYDIVERVGVYETHETKSRYCEEWK
jgi:hypothetical protein